MKHGLVHLIRFSKTSLLYDIVSIAVFLFLPMLSAGQSVGETVRINEFMVSNSKTLADSDGKFSDWIELYNPTSASIDLSNWSLTDEKDNHLKWKFPNTTITAKGYIIVFASGKDLTEAGKELHTNFKLTAEGEYLALIDPSGNIQTEFDPAYPEQQTDISYAYYDKDFLFSALPTPGAENKFTETEQPAQPSFNYKHGFYDSPFKVEITAEQSNAQIYFTTDGSEPSQGSGTLYASPVYVNTTTVLRAIVIKQGFLPSKITTATYLFLNDVLRQSNHPTGYPSEWGPYTAIEGTAIADYEMDPDIVNDTRYSGSMKQSLLSLPIISIVTDKDNLFSHSTDPDRGGIYIYTGPPGNGDKPQLGIDWARPASVEFFSSNDSKEFQADCELKIHGGHSRRPEKCPKHSFRITFNSQYGISELDFPLFGEDAAQSINTFILRGTYGNTWLHMSESERQHAQLIRDLWGKDTQLDMGHPSGHGIYAHLYINGIYWGIYNPTERIDDDFASKYLEGSREDFDVIKDYGEVVDGNNSAWNQMLSLAKKGLADNANYQRIQGKNPDGTDNPAYEAYLDVVNFIDYMIINFYGANWDWDHHNWVAIRNRVNPGKGFKFFSWDAEHILENVSSNILDENNNNCPSMVFQLLRENKDFRLLLADRIQLHCFNGGVLAPEKAIERWMKRANEIDLAIISESARWGDYRKDVHPYTSKGSLYKKEDWLKEQRFMVDEYFPQRRDEFIKQLKEAGLFPNTDAPQFLINGNKPESNNIHSGDMLSMTATTGNIYFTTDGTEPYLNGQISSSAIKYSTTIKLNASMRIKARVLNDQEWSALNDMTFIVPEDLSNLKITEINYHPLDQDSIDDKLFEFIELQNTGNSNIDLSGTKFVNGISYTFPVGKMLGSNEFVVLASDKLHFSERYGFEPYDEYGGFLDNSGERIVLTTAAGDTIISIRYNDKDPWPVSADGEGYSLVPRSLNPILDQNDPANWRASNSINGSPGKADLATGVVDETENKLPGSFHLYQNYPNPFNPATKIEYVIPDVKTQHTASRRNVILKIYDLLGREIQTLVNEGKPPGKYFVEFDGSNLPSGVYFYRLTCGDFFETRKMLLLK